MLPNLSVAHALQTELYSLCSDIHTCLVLAEIKMFGSSDLDDESSQALVQTLKVDW